eukprot:53179-Eustigmatos_ZCMA.PRE.1
MAREPCASLPRPICERDTCFLALELAPKPFCVLAWMLALCVDGLATGDLRGARAHRISNERLRI